MKPVAKELDRGVVRAADNAGGVDQEGRPCSAVQQERHIEFGLKGCHRGSDFRRGGSTESSPSSKPSPRAPTQMASAEVG